MAMLAERYHGWASISYVLMTRPLNYGYDPPFAVHVNNVIHGDLTGVSLNLVDNVKFNQISEIQANVLVDRDGTACLADFGLSLMYSEVMSVSQASWTSAFHGNFRWLAPEMLGEPEDDLPVRPSKHSDIYSFGGIMLQVFQKNLSIAIKYLAPFSGPHK
jgi:serine/threonine protein kinase